MMLWTLADDMNKLGAGEERPFFVPLATTDVDKNLFDITEHPRADQPLQRETDIQLHVKITPRDGGFESEGILPHPAIRLFALDDGRLYFQPEDGTSRNRLILEMHTLKHAVLLSRTGRCRFPKWWERWLEAACVPATFIYENVDPTALETLLSDVQAPARFGPEHRVPPTHGLEFPSNITENTKAQFIHFFLQGDEKLFMRCEAGAVVGAALTDSGTTEPTSARTVTFHARYSGHTSTNPQPMNPRELLYLLFGESSEEALHHPLLRRMHDIGEGEQPNRHPETTRMLLRPPLRTWARLEWEARSEVDNHASSWRRRDEQGNPVILVPERLLNPSVRQRGYGPLNGKGGYKCNIFVSDVCFRAGFRVRIQPTTTSFHYLAADQYAKEAQKRTPNGNLPIGTIQKPALLRSNDGRNWARRWDRRIVTNPVTNSRRSTEEQIKFINALMHQEGRCLVLLQEDTNPDHSGHIMLVHSVAPHPEEPNSAPRWDEDLSGLRQLHGTVFEAKAIAGARIDTRVNTPHSAAEDDLILVELYPGKDPDTKAGVEDLNT